MRMLLDTTQVRRWRAFTLTELLTAIAIIAVLVMLLIVGINKLLASARATQCLGKMRVLGSAVSLYIGENNGGLPHTSENRNWIFNIGPYLDLLPVQPTGNDPFTTAFLCPDDPARSPRQLRTYKYAASVLSNTRTVSLLPKNIIGVESPSTLAMLFCIAYTGPRELEIWRYDTSIWRDDVDNNNPPDTPGVYPRPHYDGRAVNIIYYDGHAAAADYPLPPATFHFDGK